MSWYLRETWWGLRQTQRHDHRSNPNTAEQVLLSGGRSWVRKPRSHRKSPSAVMQRTRITTDGEERESGDLL